MLLRLRLRVLSFQEFALNRFANKHVIGSHELGGVRFADFRNALNRRRGVGLRQFVGGCELVRARLIEKGVEDAADVEKLKLFSRHLVEQSFGEAQIVPRKPARTASGTT